MIGHVLTAVLGGIAGSTLGVGLVLALYGTRPAAWWLIAAGVAFLIACGVVAELFDRKDGAA